MKKKKQKGKTLPLLLIALVYLALAIGLTYLARTQVGFAEYYATELYPYVSYPFAWISNWVPFSLSELLVGALLLLYLICFVKGIVCLLRKKKGVGQTLASWLSKTVLLVSILLLVYVLNCGMNYSRQPFSKVSHLTIAKHTKEELDELCVWLCEQINETADKIERDENGLLLLGADTRQQAVEAMENLSKQYPALRGYYPSTKRILVTDIWTYQFITGIYSPFTVEANVNEAVPTREIPFTMCHELSHLRGFMREDEANFIAYLACRESDNPVLAYSGYMCAFSHAMNQLYGACGAKRYQEIYYSLKDEVIEERRLGNNWWNHYETPVKEVANKVNDTYLKVNAQSDGTKSYGRMVDLLLEDFLKNK